MTATLVRQKLNYYWLSPAADHIGPTLVSCIIFSLIWTREPAALMLATSYTEYVIRAHAYAL